MPDDPKKKPAGGAPSTAQEPTPASAQMSPEDYNAALQQSLQSDSTSTQQTDQQPPTTPIHGFWHRLLFGAEGTTRSTELKHGVGRGFAGAANNIARAAFEFGAYLDRKTGLGERMTPGFNAAYDEAGGARNFITPEDTQIVTDDEMLAAYGNRSDDPLASFTESTVQFVTGVALAGGSGGAGSIGIIGRSAIADAVAFDPYEAQLAELAARAPNWTGIGAVGKLLSVSNDHLDENGNLVRGDGALVARLKRSAAGALSGAVLDGLISGVRFIRANRLLALEHGLSNEARAAQQAVADDARRVLERTAQAEHIAEGQHVTVNPTGDGHFTLGVNPKSPIVAGLGRESAATVERRAPPPAIDPNSLDATANEAAKLSARVGPNGERLPALTEAQRTRLRELSAQLQAAGQKMEPPTRTVAEAAKDVPEPLSSERIGDILARHRGEAARDPKLAQEFLSESGVRSASRAELETQAAVMNDALDARLQANRGVSTAELEQHQQFAKELFGAQTPAEIAARAETANFNLSYYASQPEVMAQIEAISKQFRSAMDAAQGRPGGIPVSESIRIAREAIGGLTEREAPAVIKAKLKTTEDLHAWLLASDMVMRDMGKRIARMSEVLDARPHDVIAHDEARIALENFYNVTREVAGANSEVGRALRILQERGTGATTKPLKYKAAGTAAAEATPAAAAPKGKAKVQGPQQITAGMSHREIAAQARMIRMAGGSPRDLFAVGHAAQVIRNTGSLSKAFEVFANFLLSGPRTVQTVFASGAGLNIFEPTVRMLAGAATGNRALFREGADIMWGNFKYIADNVKGMAMSLRAGRSIVNPQPQHIAIGGVTGDVVRIPGRILGAADEFSRLTAYRAYVRAKSLRLGREQGLVGAALETRVAEDLRAAIDPETGIATLPEALKYAEVPTMAAPLGRDTFGGGLQNFVNNHLEARFIAPFVKASVNIFRYVHKSIPGLNLLNREVREALSRGGEEAAIIHTRSAVAGTVYAFGLYQAAAGNLTGRGPSDPDLRRLWLANHQPYSIRVGGKWVSYARLDPLAMPLGLISDLSTVIHESDEKSAEPTDLAYATVAALFYNLSSKSYMSGITQFSEAWGSNDPHATARWMQNFAANAAVPQAVNSLNPDGVYRDVRSLADAIISRIPGWSTTLDPKFDIFGEPVLKTPGLLNRNQILTAKDTGRSVEDDLLTLNHGLSPLSPKIEGGLINLQDRHAFDNGTGKSPFIRMMELIRHPDWSSYSLRAAMQALVQSPTWQQASDGTSLFPGGERWIRAAALKDKYESRALRQVMDEYPKLRNQIQAVRRMRGAAITSGESGVQSIESLFGTTAR